MSQAPWTYFRFCPRCGSLLELKNEHGEQLLVCSRKDFSFYQNPHPAVGALITNPRGEIMFVERSVEPAKGAWDVPGGFLDWGEEAEQAIVRELREELHMTFTPTHLLGTFHDWYDFHGLRVSVLNVYFTGTIEGTPQPADDVAAIGWFASDAPPENLAFDHIRRALKMYQGKHSVA